MGPLDWILWQDENLLVVNKPAGLLCLPDGYDPQIPYLLALLKDRFGPIWVVHRLDRDTSGVMVFARTAGAHRELNTQFEGRQVSKSYHALVNGEPGWPEKTVKLPLRINGDRQHRTVVDSRGGKAASTTLRLLEGFGAYALVEARPHTGRRHQVRAHLAALGLPIVADKLYGGGEGLQLSDLKPVYRPGRGAETPILERLALHAHCLALRCPSSNQELSFEAPYPKDFNAALKYLRKRPA